MWPILFLIDALRQISFENSISYYNLPSKASCLLCFEPQLPILFKESLI